MTNRPATLERREALSREAVQIIERDYRRQIDLNTVAAQIATSRRQLQRAFAEIGGTTFRTYLAQVRMQRALELLREGSMPVRQVRLGMPVATLMVPAPRSQSLTRRMSPLLRVASLFLSSMPARPWKFDTVEKRLKPTPGFCTNLASSVL